MMEKKNSQDTVSNSASFEDRIEANERLYQLTQNRKLLQGWKSVAYRFGPPDFRKKELKVSRLRFFRPPPFPKGGEGRVGKGGE